MATKTETLRVRVTNEEKQMLEQVATKRKTTPARVIRRVIKQLYYTSND